MIKIVNQKYLLISARVDSVNKFYTLVVSAMEFCVFYAQQYFGIISVVLKRLDTIIKLAFLLFTQFTPKER